MGVGDKDPVADTAVQEDKVAMAVVGGDYSDSLSQSQDSSDTPSSPFYIYRFYKNFRRYNYCLKFYLL